MHPDKPMITRIPWAVATVANWADAPASANELKNTIDAKTGESQLSSGGLPTLTADTAVTRNIATLAAMRVRVTAPHRRPADRSPLPRRTAGIEACPSRTHSGHWNPTEAGTMHSGQIGLSHRVQKMPVGRSGCR